MLIASDRLCFLSVFSLLDVLLCCVWMSTSCEVYLSAKICGFISAVKMNLGATVNNFRLLFQVSFNQRNVEIHIIRCE